jgi:hypothetical protein
MKSVLQLARSRRIVRNAITVSLVVGTVLNLINQGGPVLRGEHVAWWNVLMNYVVPYCVSTYSAVRNQLSQCDEQA